MDDIESVIQKSIHAFYKEYTKELDAYILSFFGSYEEAKKSAHLFVLEEEQMYKTEPSAVSLSDNVYTIVCKYRLRPKTTEELNKDRIDAFLDEKANPKICIVCGKIANNTPHIDTIHGVYHNGCVDGRTEGD